MTSESTLEVWIEADHDRVFDAITTRDGLDAWWGRCVAAEPKEGFVVEFDHSLGDLLRFEITELVPDQRVTWMCVSTFEDPSNPATEWRDQRLTFDVQPRRAVELLGTWRDVTILRFTQTWPPDSRWHGFCMAGWGQVLNDGLKTRLEENG
jgi:uncharacterized protein YndB with AHSA1/START domain